MRVAVIEPYYGGSHQAWADGYRANSQHQVTLFTHEARFWKWRMHGSYVTLAGEFVEYVREHGRFDVILATDMVHLPAFLGAVGTTRADATVALYMHENQLTYPLSPRDSVDEAYAMINWASMTVADAVYFNSRFHHDVWFAQIGGLLNRFPDYKHTDLLPAVVAKASVLPIGVDLSRFDDSVGDPGEVPLILWNQRWDFDKGPNEFAAAMIELATSHDFALALAGEQITEIEAFTRLQVELGDRIVHGSFATDAEYAALLGGADIVVSTATQEFFGIAVTEAIYAGAFPVLPSTLVYPERIPPGLHSACLYEEGALVDHLRWALDHPAERQRVVSELRAVMAKFDWPAVAPLYDAALSEIHGG